MADTTERAAEGVPEATPDATPGTVPEPVETVGAADSEAPAPEAPAAEAPAAPRVVFVETPAPPPDKGNRVLGGLLAVLGGVIFALVYALAALIWLATVPSAMGFFPGAIASGDAVASFLGSAYFWAPVLFFTLGFVILALVLNRAGWWLHVLGSILVALFTLFASIGALLLVEGILFKAGAEAASAYWSLALDPRLLIAAVIGRETVIWVGLAIAARGHHVKLGNAERRAAFERELEHKKAEHERAAALA